MQSLATQGKKKSEHALESMRELRRKLNMLQDRMETASRNGGPCTMQNEIAVFEANSSILLQFEECMNWYIAWWTKTGMTASHQETNVAQYSRSGGDLRFQGIQFQWPKLQSFYSNYRIDMQRLQDRYLGVFSLVRDLNPSDLIDISTYPIPAAVFDNTTDGKPQNKNHGNFPIAPTPPPTQDQPNRNPNDRNQTRPQIPAKNPSRNANVPKSVPDDKTPISNAEEPPVQEGTIASDLQKLGESSKHSNSRKRMNEPTRSGITDAPVAVPHSSDRGTWKPSADGQESNKNSDNAVSTTSKLPLPDNSSRLPNVTCTTDRGNPPEQKPIGSETGSKSSQSKEKGANIPARSVRPIVDEQIGKESTPQHITTTPLKDHPKKPTETVLVHHTSSSLKSENRSSPRIENRKSSRHKRSDEVVPHESQSVMPTSSEPVSLDDPLALIQVAWKMDKVPFIDQDATTSKQQSPEPSKPAEESNFISNLGIGVTLRDTNKPPVSHPQPFHNQSNSFSLKHTTSNHSNQARIQSGDGEFGTIPVLPTPSLSNRGVVPIPASHSNRGDNTEGSSQISPSKSKSGPHPSAFRNPTKTNLTEQFHSSPVDSSSSSQACSDHLQEKASLKDDVPSLSLLPDPPANDLVESGLSSRTSINTSKTRVVPSPPPVKQSQVDVFAEPSNDGHEAPTSETSTRNLRNNGSRRGYQSVDQPGSSSNGSTLRSNARPHPLNQNIGEHSTPTSTPPHSASQLSQHRDKADPNSHSQTASSAGSPHSQPKGFSSGGVARPENLSTSKQISNLPPTSDSSDTPGSTSSPPVGSSPDGDGKDTTQDGNVKKDEKICGCCIIM